MEMKSGYKLTEVGVIPEDWDAIELGRALKSMQLGGNYKNSERETNWPLIKMGNLDRGNIKLDKVEFVDRSQRPVLRDKLYRDDVLFNTRNTLDLVGKVALWRDELPEAYFNSNIMRMEFDHVRVSSKRFMNYNLNTPQSLKSLRGIAIGTTSVAAIYTRDLVKVVIPLPRKPEQEAIAEALSDADALIDQLERLFAKKRQVKRGAMQELLAGKKRLPGFATTSSYKLTEVGMIPSDWEAKSLGRIAPIVTGNTPSTRVPENYGNEFLFVSPVDMGSTKYISSTEKMLSTKGFSISRPFPKGSVLFVCIGSTIGKCGIASQVLTSNQQINALLPSSSIASEYLYYAACAIAPKVKSLAGEHAVPIVNKTAFSETSIPFPPNRAEQEAIAMTLSDMDSELAALEAKLAKACRLKQGMMQELLTGRVRLI